MACLYTTSGFVSDGIVGIKRPPPKCHSCKCLTWSRRLHWRAAASCVLGHTTTQEDHLDSPPGSQTRSEGLRVLGGLLRHHTEMELARKANKISLHLSLKPGAELVCVMGFSVVLFVCLFGLEPADTQHGVAGGVEVEGMESRGMKGAEERWLWRLLACLMRMWDARTSPRGDEWPAEKRRGKAAPQIHTNFRIRATKTKRCLWSFSRCFLFFPFFLYAPYTDDSTKCMSIPLGFFSSLSNLKASSVTGFVKKNKINYSWAENLCDMIIFPFLAELKAAPPQ